MNGKARLYLLTVILIAAALYGLSWIYGPSRPLEYPRDWVGLAFCAIFGILAEAMAVDFRVGAVRQARSSLAFLPFLSALTLFPTLPAVTVIALVSAISQFGMRRAQVLKGLFNVAQGAISGFAASAVFLALGGSNVADWRLALAFIPLACSFFIANMLLTSVAVAWLRETSVLDSFLQIVGPGGANLRYDVFASSLALVPVVLYRDHGFVGVILVITPLLLVRYSYLSLHQLIDQNKDLLRALVRAIETRDPYTSGHSVRVATLAVAIAQDIGLPKRKQNYVEIAALLHDIGKIDSAYAEVLSKPYSLNPEERRLIQTHAARGAEILQAMSSVSSDVVLSVRHHHERYDGFGYPDGLAGDSIPLPARIIMLCDSIDAMLSDRPYRRALSIAEVQNEIARCSGTQFDPSIVAIVVAKGTLERAVALIGAEIGLGNLELATWA
ncbi:MAG TPA: HD-GYP domain-containing protein [Longimicrobiales bacterium]